MRDDEAQCERWLWLETAERTPVMYCGSEITACVNLLSLELAGVKSARLYPGRTLAVPTFQEGQ